MWLCSVNPSLKSIYLSRHHIANKIFSFQDLDQHSEYVTLTSLISIRSELVKRIVFIPDGNFFLSCSSSCKDPLVLRNMDERKRKTYVFKVTKVGYDFEEHEDNTTWWSLLNRKVKRLKRMFKRNCMQCSLKNIIS